MRRQSSRLALALTLVTATGFGPGDREVPIERRLTEALEREGRAETGRAIERRVSEGELWVRDVASGVTLSARLLLPRGPLREAPGHLTQRVSGGERWVIDGERGLQDLIGLEAPPPDESLRYEVHTEHAAGVRFVGRTLELLDAGGAPRLRMAPPWLIDATGRRVDLDVTVSGCAHDVDPRAPRGREPIAPGRACRVDLSWAGANVRYPVVVDPTWSATDALAVARMEMAIGVLGDGTVLVAGGVTSLGSGGVSVTDAAEIFDPATETFAATMPLPEGRGQPWFARLLDGRLLVGGGARSSPSSTVVPGAVADDAATGMWTAVAAPAARVWASAVTLPDGSVLVAGGKTDDYFGLTSSATAAVYDPSTNTWTPTGNMAVPRYGNFVLAPLPGGRVLVAGGWQGLSTTLTNAEVYDPTSNDWTPTGPLAIGRGTGLFAALSSGEVVVAGGSTNVAGTLMSTSTTEVYDPTMGVFGPAGAIGAPVDYRTNGALSWPDGTVVAPAGVGARGLYSERFVPGSGSWETGCDPTRTYLVAVGAVLLPDGRALVVGGRDGTGILGSAWLSGPEAGACDDGDPCTDDACDTGLGACTFTPNSASCDDGDVCTSDDLCSAGTCSGVAIAGCGLDAGELDAGEPDAGEPDAGELDAGLDAGAPDTGTPDAPLPFDGGRDAPGTDAGVVPVMTGGCGCRGGAGARSGVLVSLAFLALLWARRRTRT